MQVTQGTVGPLPCLAAGEGEPIVVLGGLWPQAGVDGRALERVAASMAIVFGRGRRSLFLNRRPHLPRGMTMRQMAAEHADAIRAGLQPPVNVAGLSTGGSIAQQLAADHPDVVHRLVLVSTACRLAPHSRAMQRRAAARVRRGAEGKAFAVLAADLAGDGVRGFAAGLAGRVAGPRIFRDGLADLATTIEAEDEFDLSTADRPIAAPTLILAGEKDRFYTRELFEETARLIPRSSLRILPGRGHTDVFKDPEFARALDAFLRDSGAG
jgi:pimeloyl-ACP methyl ester carboxylesterase